MIETNEIVYKAIGDSITKGAGSFISKGYVQRYAQFLQAVYQRPVRVENFAQTKMTSQDLLFHIRSPRILESISHANLVTVTIGGNDLLNANRKFLSTYNPSFFHEALHDFEMNLRDILFSIHSVKFHQPPPYLIQLVGLYNPYPDLDYGDFWVERFNHVMKNFENNRTQFVDIFPYFKQGGRKLLSFRGVHPNPAGHQLIAEALLAKSPLFFDERCF